MTATETRSLQVFGQNQIFFPTGVHANSSPDDAWDAQIIADDAGDEVAAVYGHIDNNENARIAADIVHAVNCHEELLAACQAAFEELAAINTNQELIDQLDSAIARATN